MYTVSISFEEICQIGLNSADSSLSEAFLWDEDSRHCWEFLADALLQSVYGGIDAVSQS